MEYDVKAIGCIVLFGGRTVISDAGGRVITDKYYKFLCIHKYDKHQEFIQCGYPTARHICALGGIELPSEFNPFADDGANGDVGGRGEAGVEDRVIRTLNRGRKQLLNAIMLFVTVNDVILQPQTPIFKIKNRVEGDMHSAVEWRDVKAVNTILGRFHTTMPQIIGQLETYGRTRRYNFDILIGLVDENEIIPNNYR